MSRNVMLIVGVCVVIVIVLLIVRFTVWAD
jgi:hypothetical protein